MAARHRGGHAGQEASTVTFTTGKYSTLRLQQLLAQLGYLPLTWTPAGAGRRPGGLHGVGLGPGRRPA
jgi:hypothetical protein